MPRIRTRPGDILADEDLTPLGLSARQIAAEIGMPPNRISEIVRARRGITADTAIRRGVRFGTSPQFWLNLQNAHDLSKARATAEYSAVRAREVDPAARS